MEQDTQHSKLVCILHLDYVHRGLRLLLLRGSRVPRIHQCSTGATSKLLSKSAMEMVAVQCAVGVGYVLY